MNLNYNEILTFYSVKSGEYANNKVLDQKADIPCIFVQATSFSHNAFRDNIDADAVCYPDFNQDFIRAYSNRLEGMYVLAPLFDIREERGWYKVIQCTINRDHLLGNEIDNIELLLKKTEKILVVS